MSAPALTIPPWANGPEGSGNGGWSAGMFTRALEWSTGLDARVSGDDGVDAGRGDVELVGRAVEVTLRVPPPLGVPLRVDAAADPAVLYHDSVVVATARKVPMHVIVPASVLAVTSETASSASAGFPFRDCHPFPTCIACGTERPPGWISLGVQCGPLAAVPGPSESPVFADTWQPDASVAGSDRVVSVAACWSALDCPSSAPFADPHAERPIVLGRMTTALGQPVHVDCTYIALAWADRIDGRRHFSTSILVDDSGVVVGAARAVWFEVRGA